jgi:Mg-chelatase subunit ChlD
MMRWLKLFGIGLAVIACLALISLNEARKREQVREVAKEAVREALAQRPGPSRPPDASRTKAVAFIVDTSGSMAQPLQGRPRIACAKESLLRILEIYERHDDEAHDLEAGLWCFGKDQLRNPLPQGTFSYEALRRAVKDLDSPGGVTPFGTRIGTAIEAAAKALAARPAASRAIVFLTDGENTAGPAPEDVYRSLLDSAKASGTKPIDLYLIAFTVERKHFAGLQALGARVEEANDVESLTRVFSDYSQTILEEPLAPEPAPQAPQTPPPAPPAPR